MITKEEAKEITKNYIEERGRDYININEPYLEKNKEIAFGKYETQKRDIYKVCYEDEGYDRPDLYFITIEAYTGEVLYTSSEHGYVELMEED